MSPGTRQDVAADVVEVMLPSALSDAADGSLAIALTLLFGELRDRLMAMPDGHGILVVARGDSTSVVVGALRALLSSLAREMAPRRVNGIVADPGVDTGRAQAFLCSPAATMLTGAVLIGHPA